MGKRKLFNSKGESEDSPLKRQGRSMPNCKRQGNSLPRKQLRKQARSMKKEKKHDYFSKQKALPEPASKVKEIVKKVQFQIEPKIKQTVTINTTDKIKAEEKLKKIQTRQRKRRLMEDNKVEDKHIKQLEKRLKMNKRKSKSYPKAFVADGLDLILDACDSQKIRDFNEADLDECDSDFNEDFALATGQLQKDKPDKVTKQKPKIENNPDFKGGSKPSHLDEESGGSSEEDGDDDMEDDDEMEGDGEEGDGTEEDVGTEEDDVGTEEDDVGTEEDNMEDDQDPSENETSEEDDEEDTFSDNDDDQKTANKKKTLVEEAVREDIYGRFVKADGSVVPSTRYVPPQQRTQDDDESASKLRLTKQMKGLLNRLNESNMPSIVNEIERLFMSNSRNAMNSVLIKLALETIVRPDPQPEKIIQEQCLLIAILHANIGPEIGARVIEVVAKKFNDWHEIGGSYGEGKECDNLLLIIVYLYTFKVVHAALLYDILDIIISSFQEKCIELILLILKSAGFSLRKDDPLRLKGTIIKIQSQAKAVESNFHDKSRIHYMLDVLLAIRNNNMHKIPNYDVSHIEHLRKLSRTFIRKGNSISELTVSMDDLLNSENKGRWWIVGSSWSGKSDAKTKDSNVPVELPVSTELPISSKIMDLAMKLHINTDIRKNIFSIIMTAEDYIDAFNKILKLSLKNIQEKEAIHVAMECCLQEKTYNPYYGLLLQKFCTHDRKYQIIVQFSVWDKLKELHSATTNQISHLSHLVSHLILTKAQPLSVLKVIEYSDINKSTVRFLRQTLLKVLLHEPQTDMQEIFARVAGSPKLHMFREGISLFMRHFMLKNKSKLPSNVNQNLEMKIELAENALHDSDNTIKF